jgi:hypothetical protein
MKVNKRLLVPLLLVAAGCGSQVHSASSHGPSAADLAQVGDAPSCTNDLSQYITVDYLKNQGLTVTDQTQAVYAVNLSIAEVCSQGPSNMSVSEGGQAVVDYINQHFVTGVNGLAPTGG